MWKEGFYARFVAHSVYLHATVSDKRIIEDIRIRTERLVRVCL